MRSTRHRAFVDSFLYFIACAWAEQSSGTLVVKTESGAKHFVYFHKGAPARAKLAEGYLTLDGVLMRMGWLTPEQLVSAVSAAYDRGMLLGSVLLERGLLTPEQLQGALRQQLMEKLSYLCSLSEGTSFSMQHMRDALHDYGGDPTPIDPYGALMTLAQSHPGAEAAARFNARIADQDLHITTQPTAQRWNTDADLYRVSVLLRERPRSLNALMGDGVPAHTAQAAVFVLATTRLASTEAPSRPVVKRASRPSAASSVPAPRESLFRRRQSRPSLGEMNAQQLYAEAESALARKALILADRACSAAAEKAPGNPVYRTTLAWIRALRTESPTGPNSNPYEEPLAMLARAIEQAPHFGTAYYYRGLILKKLHRFADAARDFGMVVMLDQDAVQKQRAERIVREFEEARRRRQESAATPRSSWLKYRAG